MVKDKVPKSQKSNRPAHERFKDLYAKDHAAITPELANRAPRQVAQSVTPHTSDGTTTTTTASNTSVNECTPAAKMTPLKKKKQKRSKKATKWSHVPSASDGDATHFENFENDAGPAQLAVAKMKTRKLQWSRETIQDTDEAIDETDAGESFREEVGGSAGTGGTGGYSGGSAGEPSAQLPPLERTQVDEGREMTMEEPDGKFERKLLSPQPSPPKPVAAAPPPPPSKKEHKEVQKQQKEKSPTKPAGGGGVGSKEAVTAKPPTQLQLQQAQPKQGEVTKREQKKETTKPPETTKRELKAGGKASTPKKEVKASTRENKKPVAAAVAPALAKPPVPVPAMVPAPPAQSTVPVPAPGPTAELTKREARAQTGVHTAKSKEQPSSANYRLAVKLMKILKRNNYLENALRFEEGEKVRKHFEANGFSQQPPKEILVLLNKAMDFALESVLFRADDLDTQITNDLRVFIVKKQEARLCMLEVCFNRPDLMPNKWGGARVSGKRSKSSTKSRDKKGWFASLFR